MVWKIIIVCSIFLGTFHGPKTLAECWFVALGCRARVSRVVVCAGIRARVAAIYEPPQECSRDSVRLAHDEHAATVEELARRLGLRRVGWLFTDLLPRERAAATVECLRGVDTHFLSAQECIMAGHFQNLHPSACRHASSGYFGSKFVTVCVTGNLLVKVNILLKLRGVSWACGL